jgi:hypothetical protein
MFDHLVSHQYSTWPVQMQEKYEWQDFKKQVVFDVVKHQRERSDSSRTGGFRFLELPSKPLHPGAQWISTKALARKHSRRAILVQQKYELLDAGQKRD